MKKTYLQNYRFNSIFFRTFIVLILSSIIPVLAANWIIYRQSTSAIQKQTRSTNLDMLHKTSQMVDLIYGEINHTLQQIANDTNVIQLAINPHIDYFSRNINIINNLKNIAASSQYIDSIYVYGAKDRSVFHSNGNSYKLENFYDKVWLDKYQASASPLLQLETRTVTDASGNQVDNITFIANVLYESGSKLGAVVINVSEEKIYKAIEGLHTQSKGEVYAISSNGVIVSHKDKNKLYNNISHLPYAKKIFENDRGFFIEKYEGKQTFFTYVTSSNNNWKYIYSIPTDELQADTKIVTLIILVITYIYILLSLLISFAVSKGIYDPIENLMGLVLNFKQFPAKEEDRLIKNEYEFLGHAYSNVIDENRSMEETLEQLKPMIKEKLFSNLIMGINENVKEISEKLRFLDNDFSLTNFIVVAMQIDDYNQFCDNFNEIDRSLHKVKLINMVEQIIVHHQKGVCVEVEPDKLAVIINYNEYIKMMEAQTQALHLAEIIKNQVEKCFPFTVTLGIGRLYKDILNIKQSYREALNALKYKLYQGKNEIISISDIEPQSNELYYYHSEKEKIIINNLKTGNQKEVMILLDELVEEIYENGAIPYDFLQQIFARIISLMAEVLIELGLTVEGVFWSGYNLYTELSKRETLEDIRIWLTEVCRTITDAVNDMNMKRLDRNVEKILEYIDEHLHEDISLNDVAEWVGFSSSYVSRIFKENLGKNFVEYLNESRIAKAKHLLKETNFTIKEIGFRVGFNSIQTFMRTFKKYEGVTAGQYRDNL
ncbi:helix-turn-helix domain-containing protein [Petroclostridium sp. X23]|uniref:helix-turn-helix domain-containing protein n=1 Tax=Petroclostridium sp. X23 TaxID=3045146 RepID=UPI0024AE46F2|nr:helix-turn-helix domain-containing protein [Petroclostridium sp. X23]WHH57688.1 helix-turn-helix domain-containing protein [Petroclostridium sp. X23]